MKFCDSFAENVAIFGANNSSSRNYEYSKKIFLILGEELTDDINDSVGDPEKQLSNSLTNSETNFCLSIN